MDVSEARKLKYGDRVACPADRGEPAFIGTVTTENEILANAAADTSNGAELIWVEVMRPGRHKSVWPSNRLGSA